MNFKESDLISIISSSKIDSHTKSTLISIQKQIIETQKEIQILIHYINDAFNKKLFDNTNITFVDDTTKTLDFEQVYKHNPEHHKLIEELEFKTLKKNKLVSKFVSLNNQIKNTLANFLKKHNISFEQHEQVLFISKKLEHYSIYFNHPSSITFSETYFVDELQAVLNDIEKNYKQSSLIDNTTKSNLINLQKQLIAIQKETKLLVDYLNDSVKSFSNFSNIFTYFTKNVVDFDQIYKDYPKQHELIEELEFKFLKKNKLLIKFKNLMSQLKDTIIDFLRKQNIKTEATPVWEQTLYFSYYDPIHKEILHNAMELDNIKSSIKPEDYYVHQLQDILTHLKTDKKAS